jgi:hypothetical protein
VKREELKPRITALRSELWSVETCSAGGAGPSPLEDGVGEGENPVSGRQSVAYEPLSESRVAWECSPKREVNFFQS